MTPIVKGLSVLEIVIKRDSRLGEHWLRLYSSVTVKRNGSLTYIARPLFDLPLIFD